MPDQSGAFPITAPLLERHYKEVRSFQEARARSAALFSRGAIVALASPCLPISVSHGPSPRCCR